MSVTLYLLVAVAGGTGAVARFSLDAALRARRPEAPPWPTLLINVSGSFLLGLLTGLVIFHGVTSNLTAVLGTGFCGGYTTFSTASFETVRLAQQRAAVLALGYAIATPALSVLAAGAALLLVHG
jgi:CrcB protein